MTLNNIFKFLDLTGIYEPSAIQPLADGRFLVVEDEKQRPFSLLTIGLNGRVSSAPLSPGSPETGDAPWKLDDLEGLALDQSGYVYALTSHSRDDDGDEKKSRDKLVRFRIEGKHLVAPFVVKGLKRALAATHPGLARRCRDTGCQGRRWVQYRGVRDQPRPAATAAWLSQSVTGQLRHHRQR